jgi:hypothetical protein
MTRTTAIGEALRRKQLCAAQLSPRGEETVCDDGS